MARPISFDKSSALDSAMALFWEKGYNGTSISDLVDSTGLLRGSLYAAFKSKHGLYVAAIDHYYEQLTGTSLRSLQSSKPPLDRIKLFFMQLIEESQADTQHKGCLLVNALLENPVDDKEVNSRISGMFSKLSKTFEQLLKQAQEDHTLPEDSNAEELAEYLIASIYGLRVYNKTQPGRKKLKALVTNILSALESGEHH